MISNLPTNLLPRRRHLSRLLSVSIFAVLATAMSFAQTVTKVTVAPASVVGGASATGTVTISKKAVGDGFSVSLTSSLTAATVPQSVLVPSGKTSVTFSIGTMPVATNSTASIKALTQTNSASASLIIKAPGLKSAVLNPLSVIGGNSSTGTVTITSSAPANGLSVKLASASSLASVPANVVIAGGTTSGTFTVSTLPVITKATSKISTVLGTSTISNTLTIQPVVVSSVSVSPASVQGGTSATGTVTLNSKAVGTGVFVTLLSSSTSATVPSGVVVSNGSSTATFAVSTVGVKAQTTAKITAKTGTVSASANLILTPSPSFAGSYSGSFYSSQGGIGSLTFTIATAGTLTGKATDYSNSTPSAATLTGTVTYGGLATITVTNSKGPQHNVGQLLMMPGGYISAIMNGTDVNSGGNTVITAKLNSAGNLFTGTYNGTALSGQGQLTTLNNVVVTASGGITATASGYTNIHGTMTPTGIATLTATQQSGTQTVTVYFAFDAGGILEGYQPDANGGATSFSLVKSFAGMYSISVNPGTIQFVVDASGYVYGASIGTDSPYFIAGTVSPAGIVNVTATPTSTQGNNGLGTITGTITVEAGALLGSGTVSFVGGNSSTWDATGQPPSGLINSGNYKITFGNNATLNVTIAKTGIITGSGTGYVVYGVYSGGDSVVMIAVPTGNNSIGGTVSLVGEITSNYAGGTFSVLNGNSGSWSGTKN